MEKQQTKVEKAMARLNDLAHLYQYTLNQLEAATDHKVKFDMQHRLNHLRREYVKAQEALPLCARLGHVQAPLDKQCIHCGEAI